MYMAEFTGLIHVKDGKVHKLENLTIVNQDPAVVHKGDLSVILPELTLAGWTLVGDYTLVLTKTEETVEERKSKLLSESESDTRPLTKVSAMQKH